MGAALGQPREHEARSGGAAAVEALAVDREVAAESAGDVAADAEP